MTKAETQGLAPPDPRGSLACSGRPVSQDKSNAHRNPLYLFACHREWRDNRSMEAYQDLVGALDDPDESTRALAEMLLHRSSPRTSAEHHDEHW